MPQIVNPDDYTTCWRCGGRTEKMHKAPTPNHCICKWCANKGVYTETPIDFSFASEKARTDKQNASRQKRWREKKKAEKLMQQLTTIQVKSEENTFNSIIYKPMVTVDEPEVAVYKDENAQDSQKQFQPVEIMIQTQPHVEEQAVNHDYHQVAWPFRLTYSEEEKEKENPHDYDYMGAAFIQNAVSKVPTELDLKLHEL
jgi:hypothetical protein